MTQVNMEVECWLCWPK